MIKCMTPSAVVLFLGVFYWVSAESNFSTGHTLLSEGKRHEALPYLAKAHQENPDSGLIALEYASVAPCSLAVSLYRSVALTTSLPDSLRFTAYRRLGDYAAIRKDYATAVLQYKTASHLIKDNQLLITLARTEIAAGNPSGAQSTLNTLITRNRTPDTLQANYYLGLIALQRSLFDSALLFFNRTGPIDSLNAWSIAAAAGKLECALRLKKTDTIGHLEKQLKPFRSRLLEEDLLLLAATQQPSSSEQPQPVVASLLEPGSASDTLYTLQIGAFSSADNAANLVKRLKGQFSGVYTLAVTIADQQFYRVQIGRFTSKADAENYGNDSLTRAGITFRAVLRQ